MTSTFTQTCSIFVQLLRRDMRIHRQQLPKYVINNLLLFPLLFIFYWGYVQPNLILAHTSSATQSSLFVGCVVLLFFINGFKFTIDLLNDRLEQRTVQYFVTMINPRMLIVKEIFSTHIMTFLMISPFYPIARIALPQHFITTNWLATYCVLFFSSLFSSAYYVAAMYTVGNRAKVSNLWMRFNLPMMQLGGQFVPWIAIYAFSPFLAYAAYGNPVLYMTEGLRQALIGGPQFLPLWLCVAMLCFFTLLCTCIAWWQFKKKLDHI